MFVEELFKKDIIAKNPTVQRKEGDKKVTNIDEYDFMFGYSEMIKRWKTVVAFLTAFNKKNINVIIIAHAAKIKHVELDGTEYKRIEPDLSVAMGGRHSSADFLRASVDYVFYMESTAQTETAKGFRGKNVSVPVSSEIECFNKPQLKLYTRQTNRFVAKCRANNYNNIHTEYEIDYDKPETQKQIFLDIIK